MRPPTDTQLVAWGASLREIDPATLQQDPEEGPVRWFLGESGCEAFAWLDEGGRCHHVQLVFGGTSVEWSRAEGLRTGSFRQAKATAGGRYDGYFVHNGLRVDPLVCNAALRLLGASRSGADLFSPLADALGEVVAARSAAP
jgi:hypothetical protein